MYPMPSLYFWMSFCLSSLSSTQYSLGMTKLDVIRHSGQDLQRKNRGGAMIQTLQSVAPFTVSFGCGDPLRECLGGGEG